MTTEVRQRPVGDVRPNVLVAAPFFPPAFLAGGPVRSLAGLVDQLRDEFVFYVLAVDHDLQVTSTLRGVVSGRWTEQPSAFVRFEPDHQFTLTNYRRWITETNPSVIYINSFFSPRFSVLPLVAALLVRAAPPAVILAPRGSLSPQSLSLKSTKKRVYLAVFRFLGLPRKVTWQATLSEEAADLRSLFGPHIAIATASNLRARADDVLLLPPSKCVGQLRVIFLSRIARNKNLDFAIKRLAHVNGKIHFTVVGPKEDTAYAAECIALVQSLPTSVTVDFMGPIEHDAVAVMIASHHLLFLPSLSENYGHAIVEAFSCSRPVLIGDRTPWHGLEHRGLGHDLSLADPLAFERALQLACDQDQESFVRQVEAMPLAVDELLGATVALEENRSMFREAAFRAGSR